jgi:hypothetical protein
MASGRTFHLGEEGSLFVGGSLDFVQIRVPMSIRTLEERRAVLATWSSNGCSRTDKILHAIGA